MCYWHLDIDTGLASGCQLTLALLFQLPMLFALVRNHGCRPRCYAAVVPNLQTMTFKLRCMWLSLIPLQICNANNNQRWCTNTISWYHLYIKLHSEFPLPLLHCWYSISKGINRKKRRYGGRLYTKSLKSMMSVNSLWHEVTIYDIHTPWVKKRATRLLFITWQ